jgi:hypothetical protein
MANARGKIERLLRMGAISPEAAQRMGITREQGSSGTTPEERKLSEIAPEKPPLKRGFRSLSP